MIKLTNPSSIVAPASFYSQGAEVGPNARWLHISGQVGVDPSGTIEAGFEAQLHRVWQNTLAVLAESGMGIRNLVIARTLLTDRAQVPAYREIRDSYLNGHQAASTLFIVAALAHPDWLVEMEAVAAAA